MTVTDVRPAVWLPASGPTRGTVVVLPGRGEHAGLYERLGRRLSADGYATTVVTDATEAAVSEAFTSVGVSPFVLVGSDSGALAAARLAAAGTAVDGLVLSGVPLSSALRSPEGRDDEIAARTACGYHRGVLAADPDVAWGLLTTAPEPISALPPVATLVFHGADDSVAPLGPVQALVAAQPSARLLVTDGGLHDVLNDKDHRSVAAHVVLFLEELRERAPRITTP
ncbi:MAG: hypothetical protein JWM93_1599 [Frankiales bacterium]|nr:hypothetical protein [Frankiales bacterium]